MWCPCLLTSRFRVRIPVPEPHDAVFSARGRRFRDGFAAVFHCKNGDFDLLLRASWIYFDGSRTLTLTMIEGEPQVRRLSKAARSRSATNCGFDWRVFSKKTLSEFHEHLWVNPEDLPPEKLLGGQRRNLGE
jgi:hypothetical protein